MGRQEWKTHLALFATLVCCAAGFLFELMRAEHGDHLSWAYVFEWPLLGVMAVYMWWKFLHPKGSDSASKSAPPLAPEFEGMLTAWQESQRALAESQEVTSMADQRSELE